MLPTKTLFSRAAGRKTLILLGLARNYVERRFGAGARPFSASQLRQGEAATAAWCGGCSRLLPSLVAPCGSSNFRHRASSTGVYAADSAWAAALYGGAAAATDAAPAAQAALQMAVEACFPLAAGSLVLNNDPFQAALLQFAALDLRGSSQEESAPYSSSAEDDGMAGYRALAASHPSPPFQPSQKNTLAGKDGPPAVFSPENALLAYALLR